MKKFYFLLAASILCLSVYSQAQDVPTCFGISGLQVTLKQSGYFSVEYADPSFKDKVESTLRGDTLIILVVDQTGPVPKSSITIYTNKIHYLSLHNSKLVCPELIMTDSIDVNLTASIGNLKIKANSLKANADAGASLKAEGDVELFEGSVGGFGKLNAKDLLSTQAKVYSYGHSNLDYNSRETILIDKDEYSKVNNYYSSSKN